MAYDVQSILQALLQAGAITPEQAAGYAKAMQENPEGSLYELLSADEIVDQESFAQAIAQSLQIEYVSLIDREIPKEVLTIVPESTAREHQIIAYEQAPGVLKVAMGDVGDRQIVEFIRKKVDADVQVALASEDSIRAGLAKYSQSLEADLGDIIDPNANVEVVAEGDLAEEISSEDLQDQAKELPLVKIAETILKHAVVEGASDIHIEPTEKQVVVRYRVDGILKDVMVLPKRAAQGLVARIKVLANLKIDEHRLPQDGRFKIETEDYKVSFRVSILPVYDGEKIVMRLLDESGEGLSLEEIGMREGALNVFRRNFEKPHGMILVTGPTGSGKTTTLYATMRELNKPDVNISTIEDPIEYRMPRINQTQVKPKIGLTFSSGLRSLVRQDPDVLMVGEIRDEETAALAVNAALTGHLVLSTLHTNSAAGAVPRMEDMKVEGFLLASTVNVMVGQRLVRRLCEKCRKEAKLTADMISELQETLNIEQLLMALVQAQVLKEGQSLEGAAIFQAEGCNACTDGYKGRLGIYEVLEVDSEVQGMIKPNITSQEIEKTARASQGMMTMLEDGIAKVIEGKTTLNEIMRVAKE